MRVSRRPLLWLSALAAVIGALAIVPGANAAHHQVRISEVYPGDSTFPDNDFVELQLGAAGENQLFNTTTVRLYDLNGVETNSATFSTATLANGQNQAFVLAATATAATEFGSGTPDVTLPAATLGLTPSGGAACFTSTSFLAPTGPGIDCVAYGLFETGGAFPTNAGAATGMAASDDVDLINGNSLVRDITRGCATQMEPLGGDDTNDSAADFDQSPSPLPRNNAFNNTGNPACTTPGGTTPPGQPNPSTGAPPPGQAKKCKKGFVKRKGKCKKKRKK